MKRTLRIASIIAILAGIIQLTRMIVPDRTESTNHLSQQLFRSFLVGHSKKVELAWRGGSLRHLTQRERKDQSLDWLMLGLLSDSGVSKDELNRVAFDLPPIRAGYLRAVAAFEYGRSRSRYLGDGRVLALVPTESDEQRIRTLANISDEQRKNTGQIPKTLIIFEYDLDPDYGHARMARRSDVPGQSLYTDQAGYKEKKIDGRAELIDFLNTINDLTYAKLDNGTLTLGGRSLPDHFLRITEDDVAALWQSEQSIKATKSEIDAFEAKWNSVTYSTESEKTQLTRQYEKEASELRARISSGRKATSSGFSLDPTFDYQGLSQVIDRAGFLLERFASAANVEKIKLGLRSNDEGPLFEILDQMNKNGSPLTGALEELTDRYKFQAARYDGDLRGTEVGMTLFYTDLLAKLKALDYWNEAAVPDFIPMTGVHLSPVYNKELEVLRNTRLWFGPLDQGYQNTGDSLLFARNSTRIYAASSNPFTPGKEVEPNAESASFLGWWNDHYEEVAAYEPEYLRLNEIMKWSLLVTWLNQRGSSTSLSSLRDTKVGHSEWFPDWVRRHPELRYTNWNRVHFYPHGFKGAKTETMPLLISDGFSRMGKVHVLMGGVSLASEDVIRGRAVLPKALEGTDELALRSGVDYGTFEGKSQQMLKTLDKTEHVFADEADGIVSTVSKARPEAKFRGVDAELANLDVERKYLQAGSGLKIEVRIGGSEFGEFSSLSSGDELRVGFNELEMDRAHDLAEATSGALARNDSPRTLLSQNSDVEHIIGMDCDGCYAIKMRGSDRWLKLAKDLNPTVNLKEGWQARVAALDDENAPTVNIAFLDDATFRQEVQSTRYVHLVSNPEQRAGLSMEISNRGPPSDSTPIQIKLSGSTVKGSRGPDGVVYLSRDQLPESLSHDPANLLAAFEGNGSATDQLVERIRGHDYRGAADEIVSDPVGARHTINDVSARALKEADQAIAEGNDSAAVRQIDTVIGLHGPSPDLLARRAIAEVKADPAQAVESIRQALESPVDSSDSIFRAVNARLSRGNLTPLEGRNLEKIATMVDLRRYEQNMNLGDRIVPFSKEGQIDFRIRLVAQVHAEPVPAVRAGNPDGPWYVLDNPGLHDNDWAARVHIPVDETVARQLGTTVRLPRWDLAWAKPQTIETADGKSWVRLEQATAQLHSPAVFTPMSSKPNCTDQTDGQCQRYAYLSEPPAMAGLN